MIKAFKGGGGVGGGHDHNFVVFDLIIITIGTGRKLAFATSLLLRNYEAITCMFADMKAFSLRHLLLPNPLTDFVEICVGEVN